MMRYLESGSTDPYFNLALEQYIFDSLPRDQSYFMLWQNDNTIVVGKHQNTFAEINADYVRDHSVRVARRLSGGGVVYHDLGNINFTFITDYTGENFDFAFFCRPVLRALTALGVPAALSGRNDMTIQGKKFSGNSQYIKQGRVMHHGTLMFDSNLDILEEALRVSPDKIRSKGIQSVRSRVTNICPYLDRPMTAQTFFAHLLNFMTTEFGLTPVFLASEDLGRVRQLRDGRYATWVWNYGESPAYQLEKRRRVEGCGEIQVHMDVDGGVIQAIAFYGDYFSSRDPAQLAKMLAGTRLEERSLRQRLSQVNLEAFFHGITLRAFCDLLLSSQAEAPST